VSRTAVAALLCLALLSLAGCNAFVGGDTTASPAEADAVTPAPVPTTAVPFPPGITERRIDAATLAAAHARALRSYNYTLTVSHRLFDENGTVSELDRRRTVAVGGERYVGGYERRVVTRVSTRTTDDVAYWTNGSAFATRLRVSQRDPYYGYSTSGDPIIDPDGSRRLNRTLDALALRVTDRTDDGVVLAARRATVPDRLLTPAGVADPHNVSTTAQVRFDGVVTDWRLAYDARLRGEPIRVVQRFRVSGLGTTTVVRPDWVGRAIRNSSAAPS